MGEFQPLAAVTCLMRLFHYTKRMRLLFAVLAPFLFMPALASAQQLMGTSGDWRIFTVSESGKKTCYIASMPKKKTGTYSKRDEPYILVTSRGKVDEVSISPGYTLKKGSEVSLSVDGKEPFKLFTDDLLAWAFDSKQDMEIVKAMKAGGNMVVKATSWKNTTSTDTYSLKGISRAHKEMKQLCK